MHEMHIVYATINFLLLVGIVHLFGRKTIVSMFRTRREKIDRELDEARLISETEPVFPEAPELPKLADGELPAQARSILSRADEDAAAIAAQTDNMCLDLRKEAVTQVKNEFIEKLQARAKEMLSTEPYASRIRAQESVYADRILEQIRITPGDMAYLKRCNVLYVTITSAYPLAQEIVDKIERRANELLDEVNGKASWLVKVDPGLIGGLCLRIGDTVYDCTVVNALYELDNGLKARSVNGREDAEMLAAEMAECIENLHVTTNQFQLGRVISISDGICWLDGLADIMYGEVVEFECGEHGMVLDIAQDKIGCIVYGQYENIESGGRVRRVGKIADVPVGEELLGRVVDPLGNPLDGKGRIWTEKRRPIECHAPSIPDRASVYKPLHTGIKAIDSLVPIGRGQRELIIGDRQTGKSAIAVDTIINQKGKDVFCIYVAVGQKDTTVAGIREKLEQYGAMEYTTIVCAPASASASMLYIAPFAGAAMAEYFMYSGRDCLIIYDDLSKHAVAYRELSLLLHRPSGREAYPGDVFYLHSRLLERAAQLSPELGGGSVTALPIIETQAGDISAYIPTNVISITDGQIFLETDMFNQGQRPAINVGLSVSRVGGAAQTRTMKQMSGNLRMNLAQYRELASFSQFGSDLDAATRNVLQAGERMMAALKQPRYAPLEDWKQVLLLYAVNEGFAANTDPSEMQEFEESLYARFADERPELVARLETGEKLSGDELAALRSALESMGEVL